MKRIIVSLIFLSIFTYGCATTGVDTQKTQLQIREFQTRKYETDDMKMVMKAMLNVLQDDGYIVKNANTDLGLLTATKEVDTENKGESTMAKLFLGHNARYKKNVIVECSGNVSDFGNYMRVRINFQKKEMNNKGEVMNVKQIDNEKFYEDFFAKVDKGIFLQKERI